MQNAEKPIDPLQAISTLRGELRRVTKALETLLADGFPMRPMSNSRAGVEAWERWHLDMERRIADAQAALVLTERFERST